MPAVVPHRRFRRALTAVAALFVVTAMLGACTGQRDPTGYTASVKKNFIAGCKAGYVPKGSKTDPDAAQHSEFCTCLYAELSNKKTGIKWDEFSSAQSKIREDPTNKANTIDKLIPELAGFEKTCRAKTVTGPAPKGS
jgi:hypothetical protein